MKAAFLRRRPVRVAPRAMSRRTRMMAVRERIRRRLGRAVVVGGGAVESAVICGESSERWGGFANGELWQPWQKSRGHCLRAELDRRGMELTEERMQRQGRLPLQPRWEK